MINLTIFIRMLAISLVFLVVALVTLITLLIPMFTFNWKEVRLRLKILRIKSQIHYVYWGVGLRRIFKWN